MARITEGKRIRVTPIVKKPNGGTARIDGPLRGSSSDETVAKFVSETLASGENRYFFQYVGPGVAQVEVRADVDLGPGRRDLVATTAVECVEAEGATFELQLGEEEDVPADPVSPPVE